MKNYTPISDNYIIFSGYMLTTTLQHNN